MLHVTHSVHVGMKWHAMTYALHLCTGHYIESGVSAWLGLTPCLVFDGGLDVLDYIQWSLTGAFQMFLNKTFIRNCPLFLNKTIYRRLSNVFE